MSHTTQYKLSETEHQQIFEKKIKRFLFSDAVSTNSPFAIIFGGQPGSGKSTLINIIEETTRGDAVMIAGDDFREHHPHYEHLLKIDDQNAAFLINEDVGKWVEKAIAHAQKNRFNFMMEGTMRSPARVIEMLEKLRDGIYTIDVRVLAVNERLSWQRVLQRYENERADSNHGRMVVPEIHAEAYAALPQSLTIIEEKKAAHRITVHKFDTTVLYENELINGEWKNPPNALAAIKQERNRPWTLPERLEHARGFDKLITLLYRRSASEEEIEAIEKLRNDAYREIGVREEMTPYEVS